VSVVPPTLPRRAARLACALWIVLVVPLVIPLACISHLAARPSDARAAGIDAGGSRTDYCFDSRDNLTRRVDPSADGVLARPVTHLEYGGALLDDLKKVVLPKGVTHANPTDCAVAPTLNSQGLYATDFAYDATKKTLTSVTRTYIDPDFGVAPLQWTGDDYAVSDLCWVRWASS